jgi:hypothetical protein
MLVRIAGIDFLVVDAGEFEDSQIVGFEDPVQSYFVHEADEACLLAKNDVLGS